MSEFWKIAIRTALAGTLISLAPTLVPTPWTFWTWTMEPPKALPDPSRYIAAPAQNDSHVVLDDQASEPES